ncbi:uncharacterized protein BXZ73DRAFT_79340 [Epithele typhae]|uniref:uncharacterized protein n=1 Tax=Epithele typhae TaxID=378194 RepID=UPI0020076D5C|nr:uncharacterized protein BXZ73DRAFT_79340 [Epithele typhae]KAH9923939.1 hypothetical protein BXZ73DRAFT_79340 [Epithele typhae]
MYARFLSLAALSTTMLAPAVAHLFYQGAADSVTTLFIPHRNPQAIAALELGSNDGLTTYSLGSGAPSGVYRFNNLPDIVTYITGLTEVHYTATDVFADTETQDCVLPGDGDGTCTMVASFRSGFADVVSTKVYTQTALAFDVQLVTGSINATGTFSTTATPTATAGAFTLEVPAGASVTRPSTAAGPTQSGSGGRSGASGVRVPVILLGALTVGAAASYLV